MDVSTASVTDDIQSQAQSKKEKVLPAKASDCADKSGPSMAELKKKAKDEKAARRARAVLEKKGGGLTIQPSQKSPVQPQKLESQKVAKFQHKRMTSGEVKGPQIRGLQKVVPSVPEPPQKEDKTVELFRHLYKPKTTTIAGVSREIHPSVLALGLQMASYEIVGSCARLVATLQALKKVIASYTTPPMNSLTRHLTSYVLSPQIDFLASCRPLSISMGNAIRWLKLKISKIDPSTPDADAKQKLFHSIDAFIHERITIADQIISKSAADRIRDGDVIMTFSKSSIVQKSLVQAFNDGKVFRVIVVDSRPLNEGKNLAAALVKLGINTKYCFLNGLSHNIQDVTKIFLGAHAMMSNGRLFSRVGSAIVAMEAKEADKPVIVLCETIKFTEKVALDSIVHNEVAPADELVIPGGALQGWQDVKQLQICNLMYDVTPAEYIQMIVTESGNVPPSSVPVLHRLGNES
ncbi:putative translation initiation factor eIF-2B subunit delta [Golovinomyces cichoracearum]|uniref:Translation initiation factor eIF2B subunit delta n=1 Tax=Golovinomyces cichoracearum TaxID=62708 RepID=A0A420ICV5_9PEZI|nr:putative translation initiation factor eIF-2B subunit delta [Golovinomyces cichoracearum]